jgi:hypothetical protein
VLNVYCVGKKFPNVKSGRSAHVAVIWTVVVVVAGGAMLGAAGE